MLNEAQQAACISNLKQIALASLMYAHDYDTMLWNWSSGSYNAETGQHPAWGGMDGSLWPYLQSEEVFSCPTVGWTIMGFNQGTATANKVYSYIANGLWQDPNYNGRVRQSDWTGVTLDRTGIPAYPAKSLDYFNYPTHFIMFFDGQSTPSYGWWYHNESKARSDGKIYTIYDAAYCLGVVQPVAAYPNNPPGVWYNSGGSWFGGIQARHNGMINCAFLDGHVQAMSVGMLNGDPLGLGRRGRVRLLD